MKFRPLFHLGLLLCALAVASCAATDPQDEYGDSVYSPPPQPATQDPARIALPPMYREFFDALEDEGDWTLIEPFGWVFRPRVNFGAWRPYQDGWWEPSDSYGWIWNSNDPFGWITDHYGAWFYDEHQGWVWQPGPAWGPAWVAWVEVGDFIGWAPLAPSSYSAFDRVPDGIFTYASMSQFSGRNVAQQAMFVSRLPHRGSSYHAIVNMGRVGAVAFNKGPDPMVLRSRGGLVSEFVDAEALPRVQLPVAPAKPNEADLRERTRRVTDEGAREFRRLAEGGEPPAPVTPPPPPAVHPPRPRPVPRPQPRDTTVVRDSTRSAAPSDSGSGRPGRPRPPRKPQAAPDSTRGR